MNLKSRRFLMLFTLLISHTWFLCASVQAENPGDNGIFSRGIPGFWVSRFQKDEGAEHSFIVNLSALKIPPSPHSPPFKKQGTFGSVTLTAKGQTCVFEVTKALPNDTNASLSVTLTPFYQVNKKGKVKREKHLNYCRSLGLTSIDLYAIKPKLLGGSLHFDSGDSINSLFKPQGGAKLTLHGTNYIADNAKRFEVEPPVAKQQKTVQQDIAPGKPEQPRPQRPQKPSKPTTNEVVERYVIADHAFSLKHPSYTPFHLPMYDGLPVLVSNGLLSTGSKNVPSYQPKFSPSNEDNWQARYRALRNFLDVEWFLDKNEIIKWYKIQPKGEDGGVPSYEIALAKRRADWMLKTVMNAFLSSANPEHVQKYFCPQYDMNSTQFSMSRCSQFTGNPFEQRRLLTAFLDEVIPELKQYAEPLSHITRVAVLNWSLMSPYSFDLNGFVVQLFNAYSFYPYGDIVRASSGDYGRAFKEKYPVFETMYIGPKAGLSPQGANGAFLPMEAGDAEKLINTAETNQKRFASYMIIALIPENAEAYKRRILTEKKLTSREYQYELTSDNVTLYLATQEGMQLIHSFPVDSRPVK